MLSEEIQKIFEKHKGSYGSLRITKFLEKKGFWCKNPKMLEMFFSNLAILVLLL
ncbi:transposase [Bacillus cereus]|uniref:transposase n=1 Tax=Bacillus cereus TaxID=1396 RepID=UPI003C2E1FDF